MCRIPRPGYGTYLKGKTFKKIDDYTVHAITEAPYPLMANDISTIPVISDSAGCGAATEDFNAGTAAVGTGPFKFSSYKPGESITLVRNDDYWGDAPVWSEVEFRPIKSGPSRVAALLAGDVDMIAGVPTTDIETLEVQGQHPAQPGCFEPGHLSAHGPVPRELALCERQ